MSRSRSFWAGHDAHAATAAHGPRRRIRSTRTVNEEVWILANNHPVARGEIQINDDRIAIAVTREANVYDYMAGGSLDTPTHGHSPFTSAPGVCYLPRLTTCGRGGIGRRAALRSLWGNPWKFESSRPHQSAIQGSSRGTSRPSAHSRRRSRMSRETDDLTDMADPLEAEDLEDLALATTTP